MVEESVSKEDLTVPKMNDPGGRLPNNMGQKCIELEEEIDKSTIIFVNLITSFSVISGIRASAKI